MNSLCIVLFMICLMLISNNSNANKGISSQSGPNGAAKENWGVNYRALNDLFEISRSRRSSITYEIGVQMVEIYNEQVRDLLSSDGSQKKYPFLIDQMCFEYMETKFLVLLVIYFSNLDNMIWFVSF